MTGQTLPWNPEHGDQPKLDVDSQQVENQAACMVFSRIIAWFKQEIIYIWCNTFDVARGRTMPTFNIGFPITSEFESFLKDSLVQWRPDMSKCPLQLPHAGFAGKVVAAEAEVEDKAPSSDDTKVPLLVLAVCTVEASLSFCTVSRWHCKFSLQVLIFSAKNWMS